MLLTFVLSCLFALLDTAITWFLNAIPQYNIPVWTVPASMQNIINFVNYFLPMNVIWSCLQVMLGITVARLVISILLRIKSFIPTIATT